MLKYFENDLYVKTIFDNIKNYATCGLILLVAGWLFDKSKSASGFFHIYEVFCVGIIYTIGISLWVMNMMHGQSKLQELGAPGCGWMMVIALYHFLTLNLLIYFILNGFIK